MSKNTIFLLIYSFMPLLTAKFFNKENYNFIIHRVTHHPSTYQCFCNKHVITRGIIVFTFYCDFWIFFMYNISIILICFLVPTGIAVKYNAQNIYVHLYIFTSYYNVFSMYPTESPSAGCLSLRIQNLCKTSHS